MPGVAGRSGRTPKRSTERAGHRTKAELAEIDTVEVEGEFEVRPADPQWAEVARDWYDSLALSGQARFMEPSDWAAARYVAQAITENLHGEKFSAMLFTAVWGAMNDLLSTEASRRRVKLEVDRKTSGAEVPPGVAVMDDYRSITG